MRYAMKIDVGTHEQRVGFTIYYQDGDKEHFLFGKDVAKSLAESLLKVIADIEYIERQMPPGDGIGLSEGIGMRLTPPGEE